MPRVQPMTKPWSAGTEVTARDATTDITGIVWSDGSHPASVWVAVDGDTTRMTLVKKPTKTKDARVIISAGCLGQRVAIVEAIRARGLHLPPPYRPGAARPPLAHPLNPRSVGGTMTTTTRAMPSIATLAAAAHDIDTALAALDVGVLGIQIRRAYTFEVAPEPGPEWGEGDRLTIEVHTGSDADATILAAALGATHHVSGRDAIVEWYGSTWVSGRYYHVRVYAGTNK